MIIINTQLKPHITVEKQSNQIYPIGTKDQMTYSALEFTELLSVEILVSMAVSIRKAFRQIW